MTSARLGFGCWSADDLPQALALWGDPEVTRLTGGPFTAPEVTARLSLEIATRQHHGYQYWPLYLLQSGDHVGCCGLKPRDPERAVAELGYQLRPQYWSQGYGRESAAAAPACSR